VYSERLRTLFQTRAHAGNLDGATHYGEAGTPGHGPYIRLWLRLEQGIVTAARYKTFGCPAAIACAEALCEFVEGERSDRDALVTEARILEQVGGVPEGKEHCPALALEAWNSRRGIRSAGDTW